VFKRETQNRSTYFTGIAVSLCAWIEILAYNVGRAVGTLKVHIEEWVHFGRCLFVLILEFARAFIYSHESYLRQTSCTYKCEVVLTASCRHQLFVFLLILE